MKRPRPVVVQIHTATRPPSTLEVDTMNIDENRYGSDDGQRTYRKTSVRLAESTCISSRACGSADSRPSTMLTRVGKNVIRAAMAIFGEYPLPSISTKMGAIATTGSVRTATATG